MNTFLNWAFPLIIAAIGFTAFILIGRVLVKKYPPSAEDIKALHESGRSDDDEWGKDSGGGMNIDNSIDISNWN